MQILWDRIGQSNQHGHMSVMSACVHAAGMSALIIRHCLFIDRKGVHIASKSNGMAASVVKIGKDRGVHGKFQGTWQIF